MPSAGRILVHQLGRFLVNDGAAQKRAATANAASTTNRLRIDLGMFVYTFDTEFRLKDYFTTTTEMPV